jgi:hypothetical protein
MRSRKKEVSREMRKMQERINNRPLLMERTQMEIARERARQRALLKVKATMEDHGAKNVEGFFRGHELNAMEGVA